MRSCPYCRGPLTVVDTKEIVRFGTRDVRFVVRRERKCNACQARTFSEERTTSVVPGVDPRKEVHG